MLAAEPDLVVVNSCAVTVEAVRQTRQAIRRLRRQRPDARLIVTGCAAVIERDAIAQMPEVDGLIANDAKLDPRAWNVPDQPALPLQDRHTRAFVAVQNGCNHACTFCVIPQGRGAARSLPIAAIVRSVQRHLDAGAQEIVLTGVDLTSWGDDFDGTPGLGKAVSAVLNAFPALPRLRLSSLDGVEIDPLLFDLLATEKRVMPHIHLSLQHGDDLILKRMKRRHCRGDAVSLVTALKLKRPEVAIGADLIAGFPTEDDFAHRHNMSIIQEIGIVHGHVFPYSPRPETPAARMPQCSPQTIRDRAAELRACIAQERAAWLASLIGQPQEVLAERGETGHARNFAPVKLPSATPVGKLVIVTPTRVVEGHLA